MKDYGYYKNRAKQLLDREWKMLVNGEMVSSSSGKVMETYNPADASVLGAVPFADADDVNYAVEKAGEAFKTWRKVPLTERVKYISKVISIIKANEEEIAIIDSINSGNPLRAMLGDVQLACKLMEFAAGSALAVKGTTFPSTEESLHMTIREPFGVIGRIIPFNHPFMFVAAKIVAPVVMGNTIVIKAPDQDPLSCLYFAELIQKVFPPGVVNIITGDGKITGDAIVRHPNIKRLSLIGSVGTGMRIQHSAAETAVKQVSLELGGKNPMIVFPDADIDKAVDGVIKGMNFTLCQGQSCGSTSRLFLHKEIHDIFVEKLVDKVKNTIKIGDPLNPEANMGCLISKAHFEKVMYYINAGNEDGAKLLFGGKQPEDSELTKGYFVEPTIFDHVDMSMRIAKEEIFGPVLSIFTWDDEEDVIQQANSTEYGLTGSIWTNNFNKAVKFSKEIESGVIWINDTAVHYIGMPFTGYKNSGLDSEESIEELYSYTQIKTINFIVK